MSKSVKIYDTTLRDGTQGEGVSFSKIDKIRIAEMLDNFGVARDDRDTGFGGRTTHRFQHTIEQIERQSLFEDEAG